MRAGEDFMTSEDRRLQGIRGKQPCASDECGIVGVERPDLTKASRRRLTASARASLPLPAACDQEVNERTDVAPHKVHEEVSKKETRHHFEPRDVRVSLPRRADE